jgi:hypothetical protein
MSRFLKGAWWVLYYFAYGFGKLQLYFANRFRANANVAWLIPWSIFHAIYKLLFVAVERSAIRLGYIEDRP